MLEYRVVGVVVRRVAVDKSIDGKNIEGEPPICRRWGVFVIFPFPRVVLWLNRILVLVQVVSNVDRVIS